MDDGWRLSGESGHSSAAETIAHEDDRCRQETRQELAVCVYDAATPALGAPAHLCSGATAAKVPAADDTHAAPRYLAPRHSHPTAALPDDAGSMGRTIEPKFKFRWYAQGRRQE